MAQESVRCMVQLVGKPRTGHKVTHQDEKRHDRQAVLLCGLDDPVGSERQGSSPSELGNVIEAKALEDGKTEKAYDPHRERDRHPNDQDQKYEDPEPNKNSRHWDVSMVFEPVAMR